MVGGSGLYEKAVTKGLDHFPDVDKNIFNELNEEHRKNGIERLANKLIELDPDYAKNVDLENHQRVIRALSICLSTGKRFSDFLGQTENKRHFRNIIVGLDADRRIIYDRINQRVDIMLKNGLLEEAKSLEKHKTLNALNTVGYKELFEFMDGNVSLEKAIENIKTNTRRFAKRQLTWYRKDDRVNWFDYQKTPKEIIEKLKDKYLLQS